MIRYYKKFNFLKVCESWFTYKFKFWDIFSLNVFFHIKNKPKWIPGIRNVSYTLELDLEQDVDIITSNFSKQIRQQIRIAENEGTSCYFHTQVDEFVHFFNDFAIKKDTWTTSKKRIEEMKDNIKLSFAVNNGQILAAHSYLVDKEIGIVRHLHSATKRLDETFDRNLIGRANKYLTVTDILYFKENGFKIFDFGGFAKNTDDESLKGINNYKLLFGGKLVSCINYYSVNLWIMKKVAKIFGASGMV
jgi:hypothetical protein